MLIYVDVFSEKEIGTDTYRSEAMYDGAILKFKGKMTTEKTEISDEMLGGNKSAEGGDDEGADDASQSGIDIALANKLVEVPFTRKDYQTYIKNYMKKLIEYLEKANADGAKHDMTAIKKNLNEFVKTIVTKEEFDNWQFFVSQDDEDYEGMAIPCKWDGETPYLYYFQNGLREEKC